MTLQSELALGYGGLLERMARDRDLFDFTESLKGPAPDKETQAMQRALSYARAEARKSAGNTFKKLPTAAAKRGLSFASMVKGVFELTLGVNDRFLVALLPSELLPASVWLTPDRFNEDDKRAEPEEGAGDWHFRVTARSTDRISLSARDVAKYFSDLKSIASDADASVFGEGDDATKVGFCIEGGSADKQAPAGTGEKPAEAGDCDVRISTRPDRFGDAAPVHLDVPTGVDEITVQVDPSPITVVSGDTVVFEPTVRYADSVDVDWSAAAGSGELVNCDSDVNGRPCYEWIAPVLEENECRRPAPVTATSIARRGLRAGGEPVRDGDAAVVVKDPAADLAITYQGAEVSQITVEPEEDALLVATGEAAGESEIRWEASAGRIGRTGRRTTYDPPDDPGTYRVTASTEESQHCAPAISVMVVGDAPCHWRASISGLPGNPSAAGLRGRARYVDSYGPPLQIDAMVQEGDPQPEAPWLTIQLDDRDPGGGMPRMAELEELTEIDLAIPGIRPGETGSWQRVWGKLNVGFESYPGNAEYLRRDVVGLPEGTGIGYLLTTNVTLTRHDDERVEGTFDARFLDLSRVPEEDRRPPGVGVHSLPQGEIRASGEFSVLFGGACERTPGP